LVAWLLAVVLQWKESKADGGSDSTTPCLSLDLGGVGLFLSPPSLHGGGQEEKKLDDLVVVDSMEGRFGAAVLPRAKYMATELVDVILGQKGGPSSTSSLEAL
jgi:hypothetical protein